MTKEEIDVLLDYINDEYNFDYICDKLCESEYCEKHCSKDEEHSIECIKQYAKVMAEEKHNPKSYYIPVCWQVWDKVEVKAVSLRDAIEHLKANIDKFPLGSEPEFIDGSYKILDGQNGNASIEDTIKHIKKYWSAGNEE